MEGSCGPLVAAAAAAPGQSLLDGDDALLPNPQPLTARADAPSLRAGDGVSRNSARGAGGPALWGSAEDGGGGGSRSARRPASGVRSASGFHTQRVPPTALRPLLSAGLRKEQDADVLLVRHMSRVAPRVCACARERCVCVCVGACGGVCGLLVVGSSAA